jgi:hypothetical protein
MEVAIWWRKWNECRLISETRSMRTVGYGVPAHKVNKAIIGELQTSQITAYTEQHRRY